MIKIDIFKEGYCQSGYYTVVGVQLLTQEEIGRAKHATRSNQQRSQQSVVADKLFWKYTRPDLSVCFCLFVCLSMRLFAAAEATAVQSVVEDKLF